VRGQVGLAQPFACAEGQDAHIPGGDAEDPCDLLGLLFLDQGVPQHGLPARRQRAESASRVIVGQPGLRHQLTIELLVPDLSRQDQTLIKACPFGRRVAHYRI
jgi:hypothetical protein